MFLSDQNRINHLQIYWSIIAELVTANLKISSIFSCTNLKQTWRYVVCNTQVYNSNAENEVPGYVSVSPLRCPRVTSKPLRGGRTQFIVGVSVCFLQGETAGSGSVAVVPSLLCVMNWSTSLHFSREVTLQAGRGRRVKYGTGMQAQDVGRTCFGSKWVLRVQEAGREKAFSWRFRAQLFTVSILDEGEGPCLSKLFYGDLWWMWMHAP